MADQAFNEFYELIRRQYTDVDDNKAEGASKILQYTSQVRNIRFLFDFLERCANSDLHLICSFNFISEIMKKKGCLVPPSSLLEYFSFIERFIIENADRLIASQPALSASCRTYAIIFRIIIEQQIANADDMFRKIQNIFQSDQLSIKTISLYIMTEVVDCFKTKFPYLSDLESNSTRGKFQTSYLHVFMNEIYPLLDNDELIQPVLTLLNHCFAFCELDKTLNTFTINYPRQFKKYFESAEPLKRIASLVNNPQYCKIAMDTLYYMTAASGVFDKSSSKGFYFTFLAELISQMLPNATLEFFGQLCKILSALAKQLDGNEFCKIKEVAQRFFSSAMAFSANVFASSEISSTQNLFNLWSSVANWNLKDPELKGTISNIVFQVICNYIRTTSNEIANNEENWISFFESELFEDFQHLPNIWPLTNICHNAVCEFIVSQINGIAPFTDATHQEYDTAGFLQLAFLILNVISRFGRGHLQVKISIEESANSMYDSVNKIIENTSPKIKKMLERAHKVALIFEGVVIMFMDQYQRNYFAGKRFNSLSVREPKTEDDQNRIQYINGIIISRLLNDLDSIVFLSHYPTLVIKLLNIISQLITKDDIKNFIAITTLKEHFIKQDLGISFENVPPDLAKQPRIFLFKLYTSLINTFGELRIFLEKFDERFQALASINYSNQGEAFGLFCDLRGMFKYYVSDFNQSKKHIKACNWFCSKHIEDAINIIKVNSSVPAIVNIVCKLCVSLFPDHISIQQSKEQNKAKTKTSLIDQNSGLGIILFKASLGIVDAIMKNCDANFSKYYILFKVIRYCLTTKSANFGVMSFYGDNSFYQMCDLFYQMLFSVRFEDFVESPKLLQHIIITMSTINSDEKCLINLFDSPDRASIKAIIIFIAKSMASGDKNLLTASYSALHPLIQHSISSPEMTSSIELYRPISIVILNNIIYRNDIFVNDFGTFILASLIFDNSFLTNLVKLIIDSYDPAFQPAIQEQFNLLLSPINTQDFREAVSQFIPKLVHFCSAFKKYQNNLFDIPEIVQFIQ